MPPKIVNQANPDEPVGQLSPQDWLSAPETQAVLAALTADGAEVRFVGGCVRDAILRRTIKDVDIATHDPPQRVLALLDEAGIPAIPTGIAHGTVTAVIGKEHFEITTLREDVENYGRHARVAYTSDWAADAARRDFTMNAMFADAQGRVYDPFNGLADLGAGQVRFVGNPLRRIEEDVLRLLRYFRFQAHYGRPPMDRAALSACRKMAPRLVTLSGERIAGEILRLLQAPDPGSVMMVMQAEGILGHVLPEASALARLRVLSWLDSRALVRDDVFADPIRRLAAALKTDSAGALAVAERLKLSRVQTQRLVAIAAPVVQVSSKMDSPSLRRALRRMGADEFRDLVLVAWAEQRNLGEQLTAEDSARWVTLLDAAAHWVPVTLPVRGRDCLDMGLARGAEIGTLLAAVERWWEDLDYKPGREECLARLRELAGR